MLKYSLLGIIFLGFGRCSTKKTQNEFTTRDRAAILQTLRSQQDAWNEGNLEKFMEGYWKSDSMQFIGKRGINFGWQTTLDNYKKNYPDTVAMGKLRFEILRVNPVSPDAAFLTGKFFLKRPIGDLSGVFTLVFRKIDSSWLIVYDHTA
jgi:SnoaL-like domain